MRDIFVFVCCCSYMRARLSFYPFLWWCLCLKSRRREKKKNDDEYTWTDGWGKFFLFFTFLLFCRKVQKENFLNKRKYLFQFPRQRRRKVGKSKMNRQRKEHRCGAYNNKRVCVFISSDTNKRETTTRKLSYI